MKQLLQDLNSGQTLIVSGPRPVVPARHVLIESHVSLVSAGTERSLVSFGQASYLGKARQQPEKVKMVLEKVQTDGLMSTIDAVQSKLSQPIPMGYSNVGKVLEVGTGVEEFSVGDRVVSNGSHATHVAVPKNLCARVPENVSDDEAAFTVLGSIGLQGIRLANPTLGESVAVIGAGLIGLLVVQMLRAQGCRVLAIDPDKARLELAASFGAVTCNPKDGQDPVAVATGFSQGRGVDAVLITASTPSSDPVSQAARMSRQRGRIVLVGVTGLELNRSEFYDKELSFQVSCSYGPGRYDESYEVGGTDYPLGHVRWTAQRNFEAVLDLMGSANINVKSLITKRYDFGNSADAYQLLATDSHALGILLEYEKNEEEAEKRTVSLSAAPPAFNSQKPVIGLVGAGNYASRILIPAFQAANAQLHTLCSNGSANGVLNAKRAGFVTATTDVDAMLASEQINTCVIATRHDSHARLVKQALQAGKHVFVEKPLAITETELAELQQCYDERLAQGEASSVMVGFNRRFAPLVIKMRELLQTVTEPKSFIMTMNAGEIPKDHWTQDPAVGGGRIIGEACHYIDLMRHLADSPITSVQARAMGRLPAVAITEDKATITLGFADGSFGSIHYLANGAASFPKERIEVFTGGRILQLDNFRKLIGHGWPGFRKSSLWRQDKGQANCVATFLQAIEQGREAPIPVAELWEVSQATLQAAALVRSQ